MSAIDALMTAGPVRLRPILMSALTTVIGLMPMMLTTAEGAEMMNGLGTVVVFGLALSTLVTLLFVPVIYMMLSNLRERAKGAITRRRDKKLSVNA
jgi:HAE1 family hydrophobic/amphiphilic exporter-1